MGQQNLQEFVTECLLETGFSPDVLEIQQQFRYVPVFVFGTEKEDFSDHMQLERSPKIGIGYTAKSSWEMYSTPFTGPVLFKSLSLAAARIQGEIFLVRPETLFSLDDYFENTAFQKREMQYIRYHVPAQKDKKGKDWFTARAWMYTAIEDMWKSKLNKESYKLMEVIKPENIQTLQYYTFRKIDDPQFNAKLKKGNI